MIDFVGKKWWFLSLSGVIILVGIIFASTSGFPWGIDFKGGVQMTLEYDSAHPVDQSTLKSTMADLGYDNVTVQEVKGKNQFLVRMENLDAAEQAAVRQGLGDAGLTVQGFDQLSGETATEQRHGAIEGVIVASVGILLYIWWAFRKLPKPFRYGVCAVIALVHDVAVVMAFYAIFGKTLNLDMNLMFITGLLTVIGYSVNDTIVVFDRIRDNLAKVGRGSFETVVNNSLVETMTRSLLTSLTTLLTLSAVYLFVGEAIQSFILALIVGIISGTYSSIFIASQILVVWETGGLSRTGKLLPVRNGQ